MRIKHGYQKQPEGRFECQFCPRKYKNQADRDNHMKANHDYDAVALRKKEREETFFRKYAEQAALKEEKERLKAETARIKAENERIQKEEKERLKAEKKKETQERRIKKLLEADALKQVKRKEKEEKRAAKKRRWDEAKNPEILPFDFDRVMLEGSSYCGKCNRGFTSNEERDIHEKKHDDPKNFICGKCDKTFKRMDNKDLHEAKCGKKAKLEPSSGMMESHDENDEEVFSLIKSALFGVAKTYRLQFANGVTNLQPRLERAMSEASDQLFTLQRNNERVKYYISLCCVFVKFGEDEETDPPPVFNSGTSILNPSSNIKEQMEIIYENILQSVDEYEKNGSGWILLHYVHLDINTISYNPCRTSQNE